jgi:cytidine deaminase
MSGDEELVAAATALLAEREVPGRHEVAAAVRTGSGAIRLGLHVEASVGRVAVCAEAVAIGAAATAGDAHVATIVAVCRDGEPGTGQGEIVVTAPCGMCRELIVDYGGGEARVLMPDGEGGFLARAAHSLLPDRDR